MEISELTYVFNKGGFVNAVVSEIITIENSNFTNSLA